MLDTGIKSLPRDFYAKATRQVVAQQRKKAKFQPTSQYWVSLSPDLLRHNLAPFLSVRSRLAVHETCHAWSDQSLMNWMRAVDHFRLE